MANGVLTGVGNEASPYIIEDANDLNAIRNNPAAIYNLINDISLDISPYNKGTGWTPIPNFSGKFYGNGHVISGLTINNSELSTGAGLFANLNANAMISDLGIIGVNITAQNDCGVIAGKITGHNVSVARCYSSGTIKANRDLGGIVGISNLYYNVDIDDCHSMADLIVAEDNCGGIIGINKSIGTTNKNNIRNCFFDGTITGGNFISTHPICPNKDEYCVVANTFYNKTKLNRNIKDCTGLTQEECCNKENFTAIRYTYYMDHPRWRFIPGCAPKLWFEGKERIFVFFNGQPYTYNTDWEAVILPDDIEKGMESLSIIPLPRIKELDTYSDVKIMCYVTGGKEDNDTVRYIEAKGNLERSALTLTSDVIIPIENYTTNKELKIFTTSIKNTDKMAIDVQTEVEKPATKIRDEIVESIYTETTAKTDPSIDVNVKYVSIVNPYTIDNPYRGTISDDWDVEIFSSSLLPSDSMSLDVKYETETPATRIKDKIVEYVRSVQDVTTTINDVSSVYSISNNTAITERVADILVQSGNYSKYMFTVDNGSTWLTYDALSGTWIDSNLVNINSAGLSKDELKNPDIWKSFPSTCDSRIKCAVGINTESTKKVFTVEGIDIEFNQNTCPIITNDLIKIVNDMVYFTGDVQDIENDNLQYQIFTKAATEEEWVQLIPVTKDEWYTRGSKFSFDHKFPLSTFKSGNNTLRVILKDIRGLEVRNDYEFVINSGFPTVTITSYNNFNLSALLEQSNGRKVCARVIINNKQISPLRGWSEWKTVPFNLNFSWNSEDVTLGMPNTVTLEIMDDLGSITSQSIIVEGEYKNLLFRDEFNSYYSTDDGTILKQLDLGRIIGGEIAGVHTVWLENHTGMDLKNVTVYIDPAQQDDIKVMVSDKPNPNYTPQISFTYPGIMKHNETKQFYVRAEADNTIRAIRNKVYNIYAKGDPV